MTIKELEAAVARLPAPDLARFTDWFEDYVANTWDKKIEADARAGRLDKAAARADADFEAGRCKPL